MNRQEKARRFELTIMPHLDAAYNLARWLTRSESDAEDVVQEACLRAFKYFDGFAGENPSAWLLAIVRNSCFTWLRRNRPANEIADSDAIDEQDAAGIAEPLLSGGSRRLASDPESFLIARRDGERVRALVAELPAEYREVIVLREIEELSYQEIAEIAAVPIGTVMSRLSRARKRLQDAWQRNTREGEQR
ncbi:MAG TPA: sigma-70 family RNA polymerase sigma factor [Stellaceae bacterium]|nr:sigma-70 family RNA polymerase sigma factor [Stellaceae bacterium]